MIGSDGATKLLRKETVDLMWNSNAQDIGAAVSPLNAAAMYLNGWYLLDGNYVAAGTYPGSEAIAWLRPDGVAVAVTFNRNREIFPGIMTQINAILDARGVWTDE